MKPTYRDQIIVNINNLMEAREIIFEQIVNLAMLFEYSDLDKVMHNNEHFEFELGYFDQMKDQNVQHLVSLCKNTEATIFTLMNLNGISENEVEL